MDKTALSCYCNICKKVYSKRSNLISHVKKFHPGQLELAPKKTVKCVAICNACDKTFATYWNLTKHVKKLHKGEENTLLKPKYYTYECDKCTKHFSHSRHFKSHMKFHQKHKSSGLRCILCKNKPELEYFQRSELFQHFHTRHDIKVVTEESEFASSEDFEKWKKQEEKRTNELFVKAQGTRKNENYSMTKYVCHRSGSYKGKGSGKRSLKAQGSKKISGYCPAEMRLKILIDGKCEMKYVKTHIGHNNDLRHLYLTETERQALAAKIASKVPFETILDQVRKSTFNGTSERTRLLTKKDLFNIERNFNINNIHKHRNDESEVILSQLS